MLIRGYNIIQYNIAEQMILGSDSIRPAPIYECVTTHRINVLVQTRVQVSTNIPVTHMSTKLENRKHHRLLQCANTGIDCLLFHRAVTPLHATVYTMTSRLFDVIEKRKPLTERSYYAAGNFLMLLY